MMPGRCVDAWLEHRRVSCEACRAKGLVMLPQSWQSARMSGSALCTVNMLCELAGSGLCTTGPPPELTGSGLCTERLFRTEVSFSTGMPAGLSMRGSSCARTRLAALSSEPVEPCPVLLPRMPSWRLIRCLHSNRYDHDRSGYHHMMPIVDGQSSRRHSFLCGNMAQSSTLPLGAVKFLLVLRNHCLWQGIIVFTAFT